MNNEFDNDATDFSNATISDIQKCWNFYTENKENILEYLTYISEFIIQESPDKVVDLMEELNRISIRTVKEKQKQISDMDTLFMQVFAHSKIRTDPFHKFFASLQKWSYYLKGKYKECPSGFWYDELRDLYNLINDYCKNQDLKMYSKGPYRNNKYVVPFIKDVLKNYHK